MDRNDRCRLLWRAEAYDRRSKQKGRPSGALGLTGVALLRIIAFRYWNAAKGAAWPSYTELQKVSGFARQTIADALRRLERAGFLVISRRGRYEPGRGVIRLPNLYRLSKEEPPPLPADVSPADRRHSKSQEIPMSAPLLAALESLKRTLNLA